MLSEGLLSKWLTVKITAQDKITVILNIVPPEAEKQVFGFKVSDLEDAINLSVKPLTTTGQCQLRFIQSQKFQPLCIIEIREAIQRFLLGII